MPQYIATATFSEAVTGLTSADITAPNATITQEPASTDGGITWTFGVTPNANVYDATNVLSINLAGIADLGGNAGVGTTESANYVVDTQAPTCISITLSAYTLV